MGIYQQRTGQRKYGTHTQWLFSHKEEWAVMSICMKTDATRGNLIKVIQSLSVRQITHCFFSFGLYVYIDT